MDIVLIYIALGLLGLMLGSFAGATVWRLRARQLVEDKAAGEQYDKEELRRLKPLLRDAFGTQDRSRCLSCQHTLAWYDLLPVVSWLSTGGKCRYCQVPIGRFELLIESGLGAFFVLSLALWPLPLDSTLAIAGLGVWLAASVPLAILFAYDAKWYLLPDVPMAIFIGLAGVYAALTLAVDGATTLSLLSLLGALAAIGGLYWLLHAVSRGTWVGYGDATLGVGLGLLLGQWPLAVLAVVLANALGTLLVLPALLSGKLDRQSHIPFGPLLIAGAMIAYFGGQPVIDWYFGLL